MQVGAASTSSIALLPVPVNPRRDDAAERSVEQRRQQIQALEAPGQKQGSVAPELIRSRVRAAAEVQQATYQAQEVLRDVPPRQRSALQSYLSNGPSIQERLGVDLAGIDVYA